MIKYFTQFLQSKLFDWLEHVLEKYISIEVQYIHEIEISYD